MKPLFSVSFLRSPSNARQRGSRTAFSRCALLLALLGSLTTTVRAQTAGEQTPGTKPLKITTSGPANFLTVTTSGTLATSGQSVTITPSPNPETPAATSTFAREAGAMALVSSEMPLIVRGSVPYVRVEINGKPAIFLIDTGANTNAISPKLPRD